MFENVRLGSILREYAIERALVSAIFAVASHRYRLAVIIERDAGLAVLRLLELVLGTETADHTDCTIGCHGMLVGWRGVKVPPNAQIVESNCVPMFT